MTLDAIDVSDNNGAVDWLQVEGAGVKIGIAKCVEASGGTHPGFIANWQQLHDGVASGRLQRRGAYNFCQPGDPYAEAAAAMRAVNAGGGLQFPSDFVVMDCERPGIDAAFALTALNELERLSGRVPWLYCAYGFLVGPLHSNPALAKFPLWIADINATLPALPWPHALWQYTWTASVPGVHGQVDGSRFGPAYPATLNTPPPPPPFKPTPPTYHDPIDIGDNVKTVDISGIHLDPHGNGEVAVPNIPQTHVVSVVVVGGSDPLKVKRYDKTPTVRVVADSNPALIVIEGGEPGGTYSVLVASA